MNDTTDLSASAGLSDSFSSYASTNATTLDNFNGIDEDNNIDNAADNDDDDDEDAFEDAEFDVSIPNKLSTPKPLVAQRLTQLNKLMHVINKLGIDMDKVLGAQSIEALNTITNQYRIQNNFLLDKYENFLTELNINVEGIKSCKNVNTTAKKYKNRLIKETGKAQYYEVRYGETSTFDDEEIERLIEAFSDINFTGGNVELKRIYIHRWSVILSSSRENLGKNNPATDITMRRNAKSPFKKLRNAFTRDIFIDCRFHKPIEIERLFLTAQGF